MSEYEILRIVLSIGMLAIALLSYINDIKKK